MHASDLRPRARSGKTHRPHFPSGTAGPVAGRLAGPPARDPADHATEHRQQVAAGWRERREIVRIPDDNPDRQRLLGSRNDGNGAAQRAQDANASELRAGVERE
jgi:hypothetical protein